MASSPAGLAAFVKNAVAFAQKYGFDGLDLDWEVPSGPRDRTNFVKLIQALRMKISTLQTSLLLTAAVAAYKPEVEASYSVPDLNQYLDWVSVMAYDLHGSWEPVTGLHTALSDSSDPALSIEGAVQTWLSLGMSHKKIVLGLAAYGHEWELASPATHGVGAKAVKRGNQGGPITQVGVGGSSGWGGSCQRFRSSLDHWIFVLVGQTFTSEGEKMGNEMCTGRRRKSAAQCKNIKRTIHLVIPATHNYTTLVPYLCHTYTTLIPYLAPSIPFPCTNF